MPIQLPQLMSIPEPRGRHCLIHNIIVMTIGRYTINLRSCLLRRMVPPGSRKSGMVTVELHTCFSENIMLLRPIDMSRAAAANAKLKALFWKSEASFPFEKFLTRMNEAFKELEDAGKSLYPQQQVYDDFQVQTTLGIMRDRYLTDVDSACLTLSRTLSTRFTSIETVRSKRSIGAISSSSGRGARGRSRGRHGSGCGSNSGGRHRVVMNGVYVTDISRNFTSEEWDKLRLVGGHTYIYQRREYLSECGGRDGRSGWSGYGGRGNFGGHSTDNHHTNPSSNTDPNRAVAAVDPTDIVEYDAPASTGQSTNTSLTSTSNSDRGGRNGGRFGPWRDS